MAARTPVPVKLVVGPVRAIRGGGRGRAPEPVSRELVAIRELSREVAVLRGNPTLEDVAAAEPWLASWTYRHRKPLAAVKAGAVLAAAKMLLLGPSFLPAVSLAAALTLAVGAVFWAGRCSTTPIKALLEQVPPDLRPKAGRFLTPRAGAVYTTILAACWWARPASSKDAAITWGIAVAVAAGVRAWRFRVRIVATVVEPAAGPAEIWQMHVVDQVKEAASTVTAVHPVISPEGDPIGFTLDVAFPPGSKGAAVLASAVRPRIRTAYGVGDKDVILAPDPDNDTRLTVTVLNEPGRNALDAVHEYDGTTDFDPATGIFTHGVRADWSPARIQLFDPEVGAYHGHFSGVTRAGKSEGIETLLRSVTQHGLVVPVFIDLGEVTFVDWREHAPVFATSPLDAVIVLRNVKAVGHLRQQKMGKLRRYDEQGRDIGSCRVYPVSEATPMLLPVFDEWQFAIGITEQLPDWLARDLGVKTVGDAILALTKDILTQYAKAMIGMLLAGQASGLVDGFRNCPPVRAQCQAGYMVGYRNTPESGRQVFGGNISVDPSTIPLDRKGTNYLTSSADTRDSRSRTRWVRTPRLFDHLIQVGALPADELALLTRDLGGARTGTQPTPDDLVAAAQSRMASGELQQTQWFGEGAPWWRAWMTAGMPMTEDGPNLDGLIWDDGPALEPAVSVGRPNLTVVPTPASDRLKDAMKVWARELGRPVRRGEFVDEFAKTRLVASRHKVDTALREMKDDGVFDADPEGYYTIKEAA